LKGLGAVAAPEKGANAMFRCVVCGFDTEMDDTVMTSASGRCVCLRCYTRETSTQKRMTDTLRRELAATLAAAE
jgi:hypothetical protein